MSSTETLLKLFLDKYETSTIVVYAKFSFFNAKDGTISLFDNRAIGDYYSSRRIYFEIVLYLNSMTWGFHFSGAGYPPNVRPFQIPHFNSYSQKINNTIKNFDNMQQVYPTGNTFQKTDGGYTTV